MSGDARQESTEIVCRISWQEWNEVLLADDKVWDQNAFNDLFRQNLKLDGPESASRIFRSVFKGKLHVPM